ncbi:S-adenosyl-L-methionine-dependent methyltransferase [Aspergillus californicus]
MATSDTVVADATATLAQLSSLDVSDPGSHIDIIKKCQSVITSLQEPGEVILETLSSVVEYPCLVALTNLEVFKKLQVSDGPLSADELAQHCNADRWLIVRLMRAATAWNVVKEVGPELYGATATSDLMATPSYAAGIRHIAGKIIYSLPKYLKDTQYRNPDGQGKSMAQAYLGTDLSPWEWLAHNKEILHDFNLFMTIQQTKGVNWTGSFDLKDRIFNGVSIDANAPLVVDVGGGFGQDLHLIKKELSKSDVTLTSGQLVLQDQPSAIESIPANIQDPDFKYIKHNFFEPQPVNGARIYIFKSVFHNWPDHKSLQILRQTVSSFTPGYSKIWILDAIAPDTGADKVLVGLDLCMMAWFGTLERTETQWTQLLAQAGLKIASLSTMPDGFGLIEAVLET